MIKKPIQTNAIALSASAVDENRKSISGVICASVGPARGHFVYVNPVSEMWYLEKELNELEDDALEDLKRYQVYADEKTLDQWIACSEQKASLYVNLNHSENVGTKVGYLHGLRKVGASILGDISFSSVAFNRSTTYFGEYAINVIKDGDTSFLNLSFETLTSYEFDHEDKVAYLRPMDLSGISFVNEGALVDKLFQKELATFAATKYGENMTDKKPEEEEIKAEEVKPEEEVKAEEETPADADPEVSEAPDAALMAELSEVKAMLTGILDLLTAAKEVAPEVEEVAPEVVEVEESKLSAKKVEQAKPVILHADIGEKEEDRESDEYLAKNWKTLWKTNPELRKKIAKLAK